MPGAAPAAAAAPVTALIDDGAAGTGYEARRRCWYVVRTQPHAEHRAIFHLERQGYRVFCPRIRKTVRHARQAKRMLAPLFPGYVFLSLDLSWEGWRSVNGTYGVTGLIMSGEEPQPVRPGVVETLQQSVDQNGAINWHGDLAIGQKVRIADGPFCNLVATLEKLGAPGRVHVLLELLGQCVSVALNRGILLPAT